VFHEIRSRIIQQINKVVVGQDEVIDQLLIGFAAGGHVLLEGPPGTAKTLLANALSKCLGVSFRRVQFTPDMLPSDLTGTMTLVGGQIGELSFRPGPVFTNVLLADEINRTPPKTQAALLEAMGEATVTVDGNTHALPDPFFVVATQNPIEYEGTYPLPEAQLDRFTMKINVGYPSEAQEVAMLHFRREGVRPASFDDIEQVVSASDVASMRSEIQAVAGSEAVLLYVTQVVRATRSVPSVLLGASPRAAVHLLAATKAAALLSGRTFITPDDVSTMALPVLRHRLILRPEAELEQFRTDDAIRTAIASVAVPR
jgi:MoxR-like ATPase